MSIGLENLNNIMNDYENEKIDNISQQKNTLEDKIESLDKELNKFTTSRNNINTLKIKKDQLIIKYINDNIFPKDLNLKILNYKALLFYFIDHFTYKNTLLEYEDYDTSDNSSIYLKKQEIFKNLFFIENNIYECDGNNKLVKKTNKIPKPIKINVNISNFPHLIGYKDTDKTTKDEFIRNIMYESNLSYDYELDGCDKNKIRAFSWILDTLKNPNWIFDSDAIRRSNSKLKSDIIFVRKFKNTHHYVSLEKHLGSIDNEYYINSHHSMNESAFKRNFNDNNKIYYKKA